MRDLVQIFLTADLPIRVSAQPFADRVEIRFGKAFPVALVADRKAFDRLAAQVIMIRDQLNAIPGNEVEE